MGHWKGAVAGMLASLPALYAMDTFNKNYSSTILDRERRIKAELKNEPPGDVRVGEGPDPDHDVSLEGQQYRDGESATAALGRHVYTRLMGREPESEETKSLLSNLVHYEHGAWMGFLYGLLREHKAGPFSGLRWGFLLWLFADEIAVPLLGLQAGPRGASIGRHVNRLAMHLVYGTVLGGTTLVVKKLLPGH